LLKFSVCLSFLASIKTRMTLSSKRDKKFLLLILGVFLGVVLTYANHFHNDFQFDDFHTVVDNVYIRNIRNIPHFFMNGSMMSSLPVNAAYRPVFSSSVTMDYWIAGGLNPFIFHLSNFFWFLLQGILMFFMYKKIFDLTSEHGWNRYVALWVVAWYLMHPVNAETINYISARSDLYSTLGVIAGFVLYQYFPKGRRFLLYLIPVIIGGLAKPTALVFAPLLFIYVFLFETRSGIAITNTVNKKRPLFSAISQAALRTFPAWVVCIVLLLLISRMTPETFEAQGLHSRWGYLMTQPFVIFRYFRALFLPWDLSADSDWGVLDSFGDVRVWTGILFVLGLLISALFTSRRGLRPVSFGLAWFIIALMPTSSFYPLAEVTNDHRMFFPFAGLILSVCWVMRIVLIQNEEIFIRKRNYRIWLIGAAFCVLSLYAYKTAKRNEVWHTAESLWYDVTVKSPRNGRGLMNYGLTQMAKGRYDIALSYFERALTHTPNYAYLHINLGIVKNKLNRPMEAENHFRLALQYAPKYHGAYYYYAQWLAEKKRWEEARALLEKSLELSRADMAARHLLMSVYDELSQWENLSTLARETLTLSPDDAASIRYLESSKSQKKQSPFAGGRGEVYSNAQDYINLSLTYYEAGEFERCIEAGQRALELDPHNAIAYNNICSAYNSMGRWEEGIQACQKAVELDPAFEMAENNLKWALEHRKQN
jgi:tetratricopeptide (TPR) repeat protein